nr:hypothetical protein CFP56_09050 [Quercus suber]
MQCRDMPCVVSIGLAVRRWRDSMPGIDHPPRPFRAALRVSFASADGAQTGRRATGKPFSNQPGARKTTNDKTAHSL